MNNDQNGQRRSASRQKPQKISLVSAILTGRRSRGLACVIVALIVALSAVVSVAASIAASHRAASEDDVAAASLSAKADGEKDDKSLGDADDEAKDEKASSDDAKTNGGDSGKKTESEKSSGDNSKETEKETKDTQDEKETEKEEIGESDESQNNKSKKAYTVRINFYDKDSVSSKTVAATLGDFITTSGIELTDAQKQNLDLSMPITSDITVDADIVRTTTEDVEEAIPYETEYRESASLPAGATEVTQAGVEGKQYREYTVTIVNDVEVSREQSASWVESYPQNEIITKGVGETEAQTAAPAENQGVADTSTPGTIVGANGVSYSYSSVIDVQATCYYTGGTTASGLPADESVIAVGLDENGQPFIPFGTRVYVVGPYGDFGVRIAADIGGFWGQKIDICLDPSSPYVGNFGWRDMKVYILD